MTPRVFIFIGRSGSGKGTQAALLTALLKQKDPSKSVLYIYTGEGYRNLIQGPSFTAVEAKKIYDVGGFEPEFLTIHIWSHLLIENYKEGDHIIFDGTPRTFHEAGVVTSIFPFYRLDKPYVIHLETGTDEVTRRLTDRKRLDDTPEGIATRLGWYETEVTGAINYFKESPDYHFLEIKGERSIEEIHADIVKKVGLK